MMLVCMVEMDSGRVLIPRSDMDVKTQIERFEGRTCKAYPDPLTGGAPWTIGVGHCGPEVKPSSAWTDEQVQEAFDSDIEHARQCCSIAWPWFDSLNAPRQAVLIGMCFQLGLHGLLGFRDTLSAIGAGRYDDAARHMLQSLWAKQTPRRATALAAQMETGEWIET